jgi:quercetin dioxygenase-like cupin family protein
MPGVPFTAADWDAAPVAEHLGERGSSRWRTVEVGDLRARVVEYSPGFDSDHWCARGHALLVLEGELSVHLQDGRKFVLTAGKGFVAGDEEDNPHRASSGPGARVFIVD